VNNYIFQQYTYNKEISFDRLSRRNSPFTVERSILEYCAQFDYEYLASEISTISYIASSSHGYSSFRDLLALKQTLEPLQKQVEERKRSITREKEPATAVREEKEKKEPVIAKQLPMPTTISSSLGIHIPGLTDDLETDYSLTHLTVGGREKDATLSLSAGNSVFSSYDDFSLLSTAGSQLSKEYEGFVHLGPDLYSKLVNPYLQLNEIGVIRYQEVIAAHVK
jgi:hypothetical protein